MTSFTPVTQSQIADELKKIYTQLTRGFETVDADSQGSHSNAILGILKNSLQFMDDELISRIYDDHFFQLSLDKEQESDYVNRLLKKIRTYPIQALLYEEITEQFKLKLTQMVSFFYNDELISKLNELVFSLQSRTIANEEKKNQINGFTDLCEDTCYRPEAHVLSPDEVIIEVLDHTQYYTPAATDQPKNSKIDSNSYLKVLVAVVAAAVMLIALLMIALAILSLVGGGIGPVALAVGALVAASLPVAAQMIVPAFLAVATVLMLVGVAILSHVFSPPTAKPPAGPEEPTYGAPSQLLM